MAETTSKPGGDSPDTASSQTVGNPWLDFWNRYIEQSREQTKALVESMGGSADLEGLRKRWLESLSQSMDTFLRSPNFMEAMRHNFEMFTEFKTNADEMVGEFSREMGVPRLADVSGLFERLRLAQDSVLDRLARIEKRLDTIETALKKCGRPAPRRGEGMDTAADGPRPPGSWKGVILAGDARL